MAKLTKEQLLDAVNQLRCCIDEHGGSCSGSTTGGVDYSTNEQVIGTWIDGKPLYQKTVYIDMLPSSASKETYAHGIENIDALCNCEGTVVWKASGVITTLNNAQIVNGVLNGLASFYYSVSKSGIDVYVGTDRSGCSAYVTIQYTKTTD